MMWYDLVQEQRFGQMPAEELIELHEQGVLNAEDLVWREGMPEWRPMIQVPEFTQLFMVMPDLGDDDDDDDEGATLMLGPEEGLEWSALLEVPDSGQNLIPPRPAQSKPPAAPKPPKPQTPQSSFPPEGEDSPDVSMRGDPTGGPEAREKGLAPAPRRGSRNAQFSPPSPPPLNLAPEKIPLDELEFIELPEVEEKSPDISIPALEAPPVLGEGEFNNFQEERGGGVKTFMMGFLLLLLGGGVAAGILFLRSREGEVSEHHLTILRDDAAQIPARIDPQDSSPIPARSDATIQQVDKNLVAEAIIDAQPAPMPTPDSALPVAPDAAPPVIPDMRLSKIVDAEPPTPPPDVSFKKPTPRPRKIKKPLKKLPSTLSRSDISKVLTSNKALLERCLKLQPKFKGRTIFVQVTIKRDGSIARARVTTANARKGELGRCVSGQVKSYRFPAFSGDPMRIPLPIKF